MAEYNISFDAKGTITYTIIADSKEEAYEKFAKGDDDIVETIDDLDIDSSDWRYHTTIQRYFMANVQEN